MPESQLRRSRIDYAMENERLRGMLEDVRTGINRACGMLVNVERPDNIAAFLGSLLPAENAYAPARERPDYEQVVTDILVALDDYTDLPDGPSVDDARAAVMREILVYFGGQ